MNRKGGRALLCLCLFVVVVSAFFVWRLYGSSKRYIPVWLDRGSPVGLHFDFVEVRSRLARLNTSSSYYYTYSPAVLYVTASKTRADRKDVGNSSRRQEVWHPSVFHRRLHRPYHYYISPLCHEVSMLGGPSFHCCLRPVV